MIRGARYVGWVRRRSAAVLVTAALVVAAASLATSRLELRTALEDLLPASDPGVRALGEATRRLGSTGTLAVLIRSPDAKANLDYARALTARIRALEGGLVDRALFEVPELAAWARAHRWLYLDTETLAGLRDRLVLEVLRRKNPMYVPLDEPPTLDELEARLSGRAGAKPEANSKAKNPNAGSNAGANANPNLKDPNPNAGSNAGANANPNPKDPKANAGESVAAAVFARFPDGVFRSPKGDLVAVLVLPGAGLSSGDDERLLRAVEGVVRAVPPPDGVRVSYAGDVAASVEERGALAKDVAVTAVVVTLLVALVVWLFFGRLRAVPLMALPATVGTLAAMGLAWAIYGGLNLTTAFLGPILVGNGINYPILVLARYEEERRAGEDAATALTTAVRTTAGPTLLAAATAAAAYASLALTDFRGFRQFGVLGGVGMMLCWAASMTVLPAALWAMDRPRRVRRGAHAGVDRQERGGPDPHPDRPPSRPRFRANLGAPFARIAARAPVVVLVAGGVASLLAAAALPRWLADPFEYDLRRLRTVAPREDGAALDPLFGRALSPAILLAPSREAARAAADTIRARAREVPDTVAHVITAWDLLPGTPAAQRERLGLWDEIRRVLDDPAIARLDPDAARRLAALRPPADLAPVDSIDALPDVALRPFRERDGSVGRVVLVYPPTRGFTVYQGRDLLRLGQVISDVPLPASLGGGVVHAASRSVVFASMLRAIADDGPRATVGSLMAVALITVALLRGRIGAAILLGALLLGVLWMLGVAAASGLRINFLNFIALPITFGIGIDYAANLYLRWARDPAGGVATALRSTGGAVVLNSLTTIIGYGSLLVAHNRALRSFGGLAIVGELACLAAALLIVPAALELWGRRRAATVRISDAAAPDRGST